MARPIDFKPPFGAIDAVGAPTDPRDARIEVGVAIVGAGPGGLACAIRLGQLLEEHPDVRERLGDVPIAVLEKGKQAGSHLLSGAVMNPSPLRELFRGRLKTADFPTYGEVPGEAVYVLTRRSAYRIPPPPTMRNHGNFIVSLSELGRFLAEQAEALGAVVLPETAATKLLVEHGRVAGVRTGDRGRGRHGEPLPTFEAGNDVVAGLTVLAEGTQGYLTGAAIDQFGLHGENPQIWALGVKEVWRVRKPLGKIIHTMGWPLRTSASFGEFGGSFIYPMGDDLVTVGFVAGLESTDVEFSVHDVLQEFKTHRLIWKILRGGERVAWGAKTITEGGYYSLPSRFNAPGLLLVGEGAGLVNVPRLKGVHYAIESGRLAAEAAFRALQRGEVPSRVGALDSYDESLSASKQMRELYEVRNMRQVFDKGFFMGGALASMMTVTKGRAPNGRFPTHPNASASLKKTGRASRYPAPDGKYIFDKLSSVFASGNRTRDDQPNHLKVRTTVRRPVAEAWEWMCPAHVYKVGRDIGDGMVNLEITPSNCVQCGAITAKGGRLTPPEGGSGPEYTLT
jgi:electron-transferring-flavoprotein dehydrogenase